MTSLEEEQSRNTESKRKPALSVCDIMRDNTNEIIMKLESLFPTYLVNLADLQTEYLRIARDLFGTCYIAEKELLDKMGIDQRSIEGFDKFLKVITKSLVSQIDIGDNLQKAFVTNSMYTMKTYDEYVRLGLETYSKMLTNVSSLIPNRT